MTLAHLTNRHFLKWFKRAKAGGNIGYVLKKVLYTSESKMLMKLELLMAPSGSRSVSYRRAGEMAVKVCNSAEWRAESPGSTSE